MWFGVATAFLVVLGVVVVPAVAQTEDPTAESCFVGRPGGSLRTIEEESSRFEFPAGDGAVGEKVYVARWNVADKVGCATGVPEGNIAKHGRTPDLPAGLVYGSDGVGVYIEVTGSLSFTPADQLNRTYAIVVTDLDNSEENQQTVGFQFGVRVLPALADKIPQNLTASSNEAGNEIVVSWGAPAFVEEPASDPLFEDTGPHYWVRYKLAGTTTYFDNLFDPGAETTQTISDCSGDMTVTDCIPIEVCKTYTVEVAQRSDDMNPATLPTGTDADWVQVYAEVPCGDFTGFPKVTRIEVEDNDIIQEAHGLWTVVNVHTDRTPAADASVELIWDELAGTGFGGREDLLFVNFPSRDTSNPDFATIRWHLEEDRLGNNFSGRQRVFAPSDTILEQDPETANLRLVNFKGLDPAGSVRTVDVRIEDGNSITVSLHAITPGVSSSGVEEGVSDVELRASFSIPADSRCELSWSAGLASDDAEALTILSSDDFDPGLAVSGSFVFPAGERHSTQILSINDDGVPEGLESLVFSTRGLDCVHSYNRRYIFGITRSVNVRVRANDVPVVSSLVAGDAGGQNTHSAVTVGWGLGGADVSEISGFVVRWTPEVAGQDDAYYLTDPAVVWDTVAVSSAATRSQTFPASPDSLTSDTGYVVQVGVVTEVGADPIYSDVLSRVTTAVESAPSPTVPPTSPPTNSPTTGSTVSPSTETTASTAPSATQSPSTESTASTAPSATQSPSTESTASTAPSATQSPSTESTVSTAPSATQPNDTQTPVTQSASSQPSSSPSVSTEPSSPSGVQPPATQPPATQPPVTQPPVTQPANTPSNTQPAFGGGQSPIGGVGGGVPTAPSPQPATGTGFTDTVGTTHEANIDRLAEGGITRGCNPPSNSRFCPGRAVTRGEMATFMVRAFDLSSSGSDLFGDDDGNTHEGNINALASAEITRGCNPPENSRYCPDRPVTRAQMATFLARAMELAEGSGEFTDTADSPHANDINRIASVRITRGCNPPTNSRFCPDRAVTRGEMATFLTRAEDLAGS